MLITHKPHADSLIPILADRERLEAMWSLNTEQYLESYSNPPDCDWFSYDEGHPYKFHVSDCHIEKIEEGCVLRFSNGKHRTRWLLDHTDLELIPIGLRERSLDFARSERLLIRLLDKSDDIDIFWEPTYINFKKYHYR